MADPLSAGASVLAFGALGPFAVQAGKTSVGLYNQFKVAEREVAHILSRLEHFKEYIEGVTSRCAATDSHSKSSQTLLTEAQDIVKCLDELLRQYKQRLRKRDRLKLVLKDQEKAERLQTKLGTILSSIKHKRRCKLFNRLSNILIDRRIGQRTQMLLVPWIRSSKVSKEYRKSMNETVDDNIRSSLQRNQARRRQLLK
jgi:phage shock protein A